MVCAYCGKNARKRAFWARFCSNRCRDSWHYKNRKSMALRKPSAIAVGLGLWFLGPGVYLWIGASGYIHACYSFVC